MKKWELVWSTCYEHGTKKKSESPKGIEPTTFRSLLTCFNHRVTKDSWRATGPLYKVHVMARVLRTARISNVDIVMCVIFKERWEIFQLGEENENWCDQYVTSIGHMLFSCKLTICKRILCMQFLSYHMCTVNSL